MGISYPKELTEKAVKNGRTHMVTIDVKPLEKRGCRYSLQKGVTPETEMVVGQLFNGLCSSRHELSDKDATTLGDSLTEDMDSLREVIKEIGARKLTQQQRYIVVGVIVQGALGLSSPAVPPTATESEVANG